jgi:GMP synthase-like glutamine amidotransferase
VQVLVLRHHEEDSAGFIGDAFEKCGATLTMHLSPDGGQLPEVGDFDHVVVLGATWSIYDRQAIGSWIDDELAWLRQADEAGVGVLGICFGAQALATAFGGLVEKAPAPEIGWTTIEPTGPGPEVVGRGPWFQFHSDRCVLPEGATLHAKNDTGVQAFSIGRNLGVQFHPEVDGGQLSRWLEHGAREELMAAGIDAEQLLAETIGNESAAGKRAEAVVGASLERAQAPSH